MLYDTIRQHMPGRSSEAAIAAANNIVATRKSTPFIKGIGELGVHYKVDNQPGNGGISSANRASDVPSFLKDLTSFTPPTVTKLTYQAPIEMNPKHPNAMRNYQNYEQYNREQDRLEQEAAARAREQERQRQLDQQREQERLEQKRKDEVTEGDKSCQVLETEMKKPEGGKLDQLVEGIAMRWREQSHGVPISLSPIHKPAVTLNDDETKIDRSKVGMKLSYPYEGKEECWENEYHDTYNKDGFPTGSGYSRSVKVYKTATLTNVLAIGVGYFDKESIIPEARGDISDADSQQGVLSYFVGDKAVPLSYPGAKEKFYSLLRADEKTVSPDRNIPKDQWRDKKSDEIKARPEPKPIIPTPVSEPARYVPSPPVVHKPVRHKGAPRLTRRELLGIGAGLGVAALTVGFVRWAASHENNVQNSENQQQPTPTPEITPIPPTNENTFIAGQSWQGIEHGDGGWTSDNVTLKADAINNDSFSGEMHVYRQGLLHDVTYTINGNIVKDFSDSVWQMVQQYVGMNANTPGVWLKFTPTTIKQGSDVNGIFNMPFYAVARDDGKLDGYWLGLNLADQIDTTRPAGEIHLNKT